MAFVAFDFVGVSGVAFIFAGGVSGGMNSGRAVEGINFQTGVVGEDEVWERLAKRLVLQPSGDFARLFCGVCGEAVAVFNDRRGIGKRGQRLNGETIAENRADLLGFVRIATGDDECGHGAGSTDRFQFFESLLDEGGVLDAGETGVEPLLLDEFVVGAALDNAAVFQHQNLVGIANSAQPVCDDKTGATAHESLEGLLDESFGGGIDTGSGLVENEDG